MVRQVGAGEHFVRRPQDGGSGTEKWKAGQIEARGWAAGKGCRKGRLMAATGRSLPGGQVGATEGFSKQGVA